MLRLSIQARIDDYDEFYKLHFMDPRVSFFEKQKYRLRKLLFDYAHPPLKPGQPLIYRELELKYADPSKTIVKPTTPKVETLKPDNQLKTTKKVEQKPEQANVIYSIKLNKQEYQQIMDKKAKKKA